MALSNIKRCPLGPGLEIIYGSYAHTGSATAETQVVTGGSILGVLVNPQLGAGNQVDMGDRNAYTTSLSGGLTTVTFLQSAGITSGTFMIFVGTGV